MSPRLRRKYQARLRQKTTTYIVMLMVVFGLQWHQYQNASRQTQLLRQRLDETLQMQKQLAGTSETRQRALAARMEWMRTVETRFDELGIINDQEIDWESVKADTK